MPIQRKFVFNFGSKGVRSTLEVPVNIPLEQTVRDLVGRLVRAHNIPCYVEDGMFFMGWGHRLDNLALIILELLCTSKFIPNYSMYLNLLLSHSEVTPVFEKNQVVKVSPGGSFAPFPLDPLCPFILD